MPPPHPRTETLSWWGVPALVLLAGIIGVVMRLPALWLPLERDEGAYAYVAWLWMRGMLPYRDAFDHKPPLVYVLYMPPLLFGGSPTVAIRLWASFLFLLQLPFLYLIGRAIWSRTTAAFGVLIYAIVGNSFRLQGLVFNTEQALMLPALLALWMLMQGVARRQARWAFGYGLGIGLVSLIKPTVVPFLLPLVVFAAPHGIRGQLRGAGAMIGGAVLPWLPVVVIWGAAGAWSELVFALLTYNRMYAQQSLRNWDGGGVVNVIAPLGALCLYALGGMALAGWRAPRQRQRLMVALWTLAFVVAAVLSLRGYIHYYYPAFAGLSLLAAPVIPRLLRGTEPAARAWGGVAAAAVLGGVLLVPYARDAIESSRLDAAQQATRLYGDDGTNYFAAAPEAAAVVRSLTTPDDAIFVWASEPQVYLFAERRASSRYIYSYPFELMPLLQPRLLADLRQNPPRVVVLYHGLRPPAFVALAQERGMELIEQVGGFDIWAAPDRRP